MGALYTKNKITIDNTNVDTCAICLEDKKKSNKNTIMLECNHSYHKKCIDLWLTNKSVCPLCLHNITNYPNTISDIPNKLSEVQKPHCQIQKRTLLNLLSFSFVLVFTICIINIILVNITKSFINNNYIQVTNMSDCINTTEIENYNDNLNINVIADNIIHALCMVSIILSICVRSKNVYIFFFVAYLFDILAVIMLIYRYIIFREYLENMTDMPFCDNNMYKQILVYKIFLLVNIFVTFILLLFDNFFITVEYMNEQEKYLRIITVV